MRFLTDWLRSRLSVLRGAPGIRKLARLGPRFASRRRRLVLVLTVGAALAAVAAFMFASAGATLPGSSFDTSNGDLTDTTLHDWNPPGVPTGNVGPIQPITCPAAPSPTLTGASGTNCGLDESDSKSDNIFTMG